MPINPTGTPITLVTAASTSVVLYASEVSKTPLIEPFQRLEFDNDKLRAAKTPQGGLPMIITTVANTPIQVSIVCADDYPRPLTPNSLANLAAINQKFSITRFQMRGTSQDVAELETIRAQALDHENLLQKFQYHATKANSDISYPDLVSLQAESFDYLINTGVSISGPCLGATYTGMLIVSFDIDYTHQFTQADGTNKNLASWSMTIDQRGISSQAV